MAPPEDRALIPDFGSALDMTAFADGFVATTDIMEKHFLRTDRPVIEAYLQKNHPEIDSTNPEVIDKVREFMMRDRYLPVNATGFGAGAVSLYVNRGRIFRQVVLPLALFGGFGVTAVKFVEFRKERALENAEALVEDRIASLTNSSNAVADAASRIGSDPLFTSLPEVDKALATRHRDIALDETERIRSAMQPYLAPSVKVAITRENHVEADALTSSLTKQIETAKAHVDSIEGMLKTESALRSLGPQLESIIASVRKPSTPEPLLALAEEAYSDARNSLKNRDLSQADNYRNELQKVAGSVASFISSQRQFEQTYRRSSALLKNDADRPEIEGTYAAGLKAIRSGDVSSLRNKLKALESLEATLSEQYTVEIVGGVERRFTPNGYSSPTGSTYYVKVRAVNDQGEPVSFDIANVETGRTENVSEWAEAVPKPFYDQVKQDKIDDGIINDNLFIQKRKGYLRSERKMPDVAQITRWSR